MKTSMQAYKSGLVIFLSAFTTLLTAQADVKVMMNDSVVPPTIIADRPDQTESSYLVPKGYFQMEAGFAIIDQDPGFIYTHPSVLWRVGVSESFELRFITSYITIQHEPDPNLSGFLPLAIGLKSKLTEQKGILPKMSFLGTLRLPGIVGKDLETTYLAPELRLAFDHSVSDFFGFGYNAGLFWNGEDAEPIVLYTLTTGFTIAKRITLFAEVFGETPQRDSEELPLYLDAGFSVLVGKSFLFDVSASQGITEGENLRYVSAGFSYRFKL